MRRATSEGRPLLRLLVIIPTNTGRSLVSLSGRKGAQNLLVSRGLVSTAVCLGHF